MIEAMRAFVTSCFAAATAAEATASYRRFAASFGFSAIAIVDFAKLEIARDACLRQSLDTAFPPNASNMLSLQSPFEIYGRSADHPFRIDDMANAMEVDPSILRRWLAGDRSDWELVVAPVHRLGKLVLCVFCEGPEPDCSPAALAALHTAAHIVYDRFAALDDTTLSAREAKCLSWSAQGKTYFEIGRILDVSPRTVRADMANSKRKLHARTRAEAIAKVIAGP
jgi:DNA-binding CsgD family transcriptional regulator